MSLTEPAGPRQKLVSLLLALGMAATVGGALAFQHLGGYIPCKLCYEQRMPYYVGVVVMPLALLAAVVRLPGMVTRLLLLAGAVLMAYSLYLGVFHAGVEWAWWPGPTDCGMVVAPPDTGGNGVLDSLNSVIPPSCDEAALRILGLSLAGWNAIASLVFGLLAMHGALAKA
jgi:disulfide bond formation protein DsbB